MKHVICTRSDPFYPGYEVAYEYDYDDTPEVETPDMLLRCYHDFDDDEM